MENRFGKRKLGPPFTGHSIVPTLHRLFFFIGHVEQRLVLMFVRLTLIRPLTTHLSEVSGVEPSQQGRVLFNGKRLVNVLREKHEEPRAIN